MKPNDIVNVAMPAYGHGAFHMPWEPSWVHSHRIRRGRIVSFSRRGDKVRVQLWKGAEGWTSTVYSVPQEKVFFDSMVNL